MAATVDLANAKNKSCFNVDIEWVGFDKENIWGDLAKIWDTALQFVKSELRKLGLKRGVPTQPKKQYGITL